MSRSTRAKLLQWGAFVVGLLIVAALLVPTVSWGSLRDSFFNWEIFKDQFPAIVTEGIRNTLIYTAIAFSGGLFFGLVAALMRQSAVTPARWPPPGSAAVCRWPRCNPYRWR